jgi:hypothetical protein
LALLVADKTNFTLLLLHFKKRKLRRKKIVEKQERKIAKSFCAARKMDGD